MPEQRRTDQLINRFRQLPVLSREVWQGAVAPMPAWIEPEAGGEPFRPFGALWVSLSTGRMGIELEPARDAHGPELLLAGLFRFGRDEKKVLGGRASRLQVADTETRDYLAQALGDVGVHIEIVPRLDAVAATLREYTGLVTADQPPSFLDGRGVTVDVLRDFADAAARYYASAPWQHLTDEDLIEVESPAAPPGYRYALVLGNAGHTFGLAFYGSREQHETMLDAVSPEDAGESMDVARSIVFDSADGIPIKDHDLWLDHRLPLAGPRAYPFAALYHQRGRADRPAREELDFAAVVLSAVADSTEDDMDSGRWTKKVAAAGLTTNVRLSLPGLLESGRPGAHVGLDSHRRSFERTHAEIGRFMESHDFASAGEANAALAEHFAGRSIDDMPSTARSPAERAQELAHQAYDWIGRKRVLLAKQALALWPDCAEAYVILAEHAATPERAVPLYEEAVAAGRRALGTDLERLAGQLWGHVEARPYMRARLELAQALESLDRGDEAIAHMQELLRLNVNDNQGVRYLLVPRLLERDRREQAAAVLGAYPDDAGATLAYCVALMQFQASGDGEAARAALAAAVAQNRFVPEFLLDPVDEPIEHFALGSEEEGIVSAGEMEGAWRATPGALEWLAREARTLRAARRKSARRQEKRARKRRR